MEFSAAGRRLLELSEGFRSHPYKDAKGLWTIGYGHRLLQPDSFPEGITEAFAEHILACDIDDAEEMVQALVKVPVTQGQFDALVDFVFNLGATRLADSTLLHDLNSGRYDAAAQQLLLWDHAGSEVVEGLKKRREAEFALWMGAPTEEPATAQARASGA